MEIYIQLKKEKEIKKKVCIVRGIKRTRKDGIQQSMEDGI